ncbi:MAG TPA: type II toxin-antitoxin system VapC family toxin [Alphaproteobacteria bacterium]
MIVVDASAALEALLRTPAAGEVEKRLFDPGETLHAPHLIDLEVAQVLRRYASTGQVDADRCRAALSDLADFPLTRYPHDFLLPRIWELRANLTAYDASYIALAEILGAVLLTGDERLATAPGHRARIALV